MTRSMADLADDIANDLREFAALCPIKTKGDGNQPPKLIDFSYDVWNSEQRQFHAEKTGADLVLKSRQIGCTTYCNVDDLHFALTAEGVQVLIIGHQSDLVEQMFLDITRMVNALRVKRGLPKPVASNRREIIFSHNESAIRIVEAGATEKVASDRGRSGTIHRLHATEVAFWRQADATLDGALEALVPGGQVVFESTANGSSGRFYKLVEEALAKRGPYRLHFFPWLQHAEYVARVDEDFSAEPRDEHEAGMRELGATNEQIQWWREKVRASDAERALANYPYKPSVAFRASGGAYIAAKACDLADSRTSEPLAELDMVVESKADGSAWKTKNLGKLRVWRRPSSGVDYIVSADPSEGVLGDEAALDVSEAETGYTVATFASNAIDPEDFAFTMAWTGRLYNNALLAPERNNDGKTVLLALKSLHTSVTPYANVYQTEDETRGWVTSTATRPPLFDTLAQAVRDGANVSPDPAFAAQCRTLIRGQNGKPQAKGKGTKDGARDDRFVAKAIGYFIRIRIAGKNAGAGIARVQPTHTPRSFEGTPSPYAAPPPVSQPLWKPGDGRIKGRSGW